MATRGRPRKMPLESIALVEAIEDLVIEPQYESGPRFLVTGYDKAQELVKRVLAAKPHEIVEMSNDEFRIWTEHVRVING